MHRIRAYTKDTAPYNLNITMLPISTHETYLLPLLYPRILPNASPWPSPPFPFSSASSVYAACNLHRMAKLQDQAPLQQLRLPKPNYQRSEQPAAFHLQKGRVNMVQVNNHWDTWPIKYFSFKSITENQYGNIGINILMWPYWHSIHFLKWVLCD